MGRYVSRIEKKALEKLRSAYEDSEVQERQKRRALVGDRAVSSGGGGADRAVKWASGRGEPLQRPPRSAGAGRPIPPASAG